MDKYTKIILTIIAVCLIALNIKVWIPNKTNAAVGGMGMFDLAYDTDFYLAVGMVVSENCKVRDKYGKIDCKK